MSSLTTLIQEMIDSNKATKQELENTQDKVKDLESKIETQTNDKHLVDLMQQELMKSDYFVSEAFFKDVGQALINKHGLGNLVQLNKEQVNIAVREYLGENLDSEGIVKHIMKDYSEEIREAMIRRIRIESKSIIDNYDFSFQVVPKLQELFNEFMKNYELTNYLMKSTAQLFVAQENNLAFMLEWILTKNFFNKEAI